MEQQKDNLSSLYNGLMSKGYSREDLGDEKTFRSKMSDNNSRKQLYDYVSGRGDFKIGDYDTYEMRLSGTPEYLKRPEEADVNESPAQEDSSLVFEPIQEELPQSTLSPYVRGKGKNAEIFGVPYETYMHMKPESQSYYYEQARKKRDEELKDVAKGITKNQLGDLRSSIEQELEKEHPSVQAPAGASFIPRTAYGAAQRYGNTNTKENQDRYTSLVAAKNLLDEADDIVNESSKKGSTNFVGGLVRGLQDKGFDVDTWSMGITDTAYGSLLKKATQKSDKGEALSPEEEKLLEAAAVNMATQAYFSSDLGRGYKAGGTTAQSIPFMLEFALNPVSASGSAIAKGILKFGAKRFGLKALGNAAARNSLKVGSRLAGDAVAAVGMTATTGLGHIASGAQERMIGDVQFDFNKDGKIEYSGRDNQMSEGDAWLRSTISNTLENQSEMVFNAFKGAGNIIGLPNAGRIFPGIERFSSSKAGELYRAIKNNPAYRQLAEKTQFHGMPEEYFEEVYNNLANIPLGESTWNEATDIDSNIDTFLGVAPTSILMSMVGLGSVVRESYSTRKDMRRFEKTLSDDELSFFNDLKQKIKDGNIEDAREFVKLTLSDEALTPEQKKEEIRYVYGMLQENAIESVQKAETDEAIEKETEEIVNSSNLSTETLTECNRITTNDIGEPELIPGHIVEWMGGTVVEDSDGTKRREGGQPIWQAVGSNERITLKEGEYDPDSIQSMSTKDMIDATAEMMREEAKEKAEREANYSPEIIPPASGLTFSDTEGRSYTIVQPNPDGGWITEVISMDEKGNQSVQMVDISDKEYYDAMQIQIDAREESVNIQPEVNEMSGNPLGNEGVASVDENMMGSNEVDTASEVVAPVDESIQEQKPVFPVDEKGNTLYHKMPVEGTIVDLTDGTLDDNEIDGFIEANKAEAGKLLKKVSESAPKISTNKVKYLADKRVWQEKVADAQAQVDYWNSVNEEIAASRVQPGDKTAEAILSMGEPMNGDELAAMMLGTGRLPILYGSYKKETGGRNAEARGMVGLFASKANGGMSIEEAGEQLMLADQESGTNFFEANDPNAGRNAIIDVLSGARTRGDLFGFIQRNREAMAERERHAELEAYEQTIAKLAEASRMTPEEFIAFEENIAQMLEERLKDVSDEELKGIFAELYLEENERGRESNEVGTGVPEGEERVGSNEGSSGILSEERSDDAGASERSAEQPDGNVEIGEPGNSVLPETATVAGRTEVELPIFFSPTKMEEESLLDYAARIDESKRVHDAGKEVDANPTEAQKEAGNYKKGHIKIDGFDITIENPKGTVRSGVDAAGTPWSITMNNTYGYIRGTEGVDGDHIDVFFGDGGSNVYVVDQVNQDGSFDEHKVMYGFNLEEEARDAYLANYSPGWNGLGSITGVSKELFKEWIGSSHRKTKPFNEYKSVQDVMQSKVSEDKGVFTVEDVDAIRKNPLTVEEIEGSAVEPELKTLAKDYLAGNESFINLVAYQNIYNDVRNRTRGIEPNSTDSSETHLDEVINGNQGGLESRFSRGEVDNVGARGSETPVSRSGRGGKTSTKQFTLFDGERGDHEVRGEEPAVDGISPGREYSDGSGSTGGNGRDVSGPARSKTGSRGTKNDTGRRTSAGHEETNSVDVDLQSALDDFKDILNQFGKTGKNDMSLSLVGLNKEQIQLLPRLVSSGVKLGYQLIKKEVYDFKKWAEQMRSLIGDPLKQSIGYGDTDVNAFIQEMWNSKFEMDGEIHTLAEWSAKLGTKELKKQVSATLEEKRAQQMAAEPIPVKIANAQNIDETLPYLLPQQREDVRLAEVQFFDESHQDREHGNGKGYLFTNGTGTGKTYTGLGIVKRFIKQGKNRILVVTPSQPKVTDWMKDASNLGIELRDLDTLSKGRGTTATTEKGEGADEFIKESATIGEDGNVRFRLLDIEGVNGNPAVERAEIVSEVEALSDSLHAPVRIVKSVDELTESDSARKRIEKGNRVKGWFDTKSQEVVVYLPHAVSVEDANETVLHEVVGHYGLRKMFGEDFDTFLDNVYANASTEVRKGIVDRANRKGNILDLREATEEYLAELAERGFENAEERSLWQKIKDAFVELLRKVGVELGFELTDNELRYILWKSYQNLESPSIMDRAADVYMQNRLGVGEFGIREEDTEREKSRKGYEQSLNVVNEFTERHAGTGSVFVIRSKEMLRKQLEVINVVPEDIDKYELWMQEGNIPAFFAPKYGRIIVLDSNLPKEELNAYLWHESTHKSLRDLFGDKLDEEILKAYEALRADENFIGLEDYIRDLYAGDAEETIREECIVYLFEALYEQYGEDALGRNLSVHKDGVKNKFFQKLYNQIVYGTEATVPRGNIGRNVQPGNEELPSEMEMRYSDGDSKQQEAGGRGRDELRGLYRDEAEGVSGKRFRTGESTEEEREPDGTIEAYETALKKQGFRAQEAYQDSMLALKVFQDVVLAKDGGKLKSFEDSYKAENRMSSVSTREKEVFSKVFLNPIITEVARLIKEEDATYRDITGYLIAKHGLERNIVLRERKASEAADKAVKERIDSATREHRKGHMSEDEYNSVINEANLKRNEVYQKELEKNANKDYSGLTGLMENFADEKDGDFTSFAEQFVSDFESKHNIKELWTLINKATNQTLKKSYESGLMSLEQYESLKGRFKTYVPLRGWDETMADEVYEYLDNMRSPVNSLLKSADGRKSLADDPIATIGNMADSTILQGNRNVMKQNFLNFVINHPSDLAQVKDMWYAKDNVSGDFVPSFPNIPENATAEDIANIVSEHEENMKFLEKDGLAKRGMNELGLSYKILPYQKSEHIVSMKRNGKDVVVYINGNPRVAQALNGLTNPDVESNAILSGLGKLNRILAANFTTRNPAFVLSNLSRDLIFSTSAVAVKETPLYLARFSTNIPKSIAAVIKGIRGNSGTSEADKYFQEFLDNGGETGYANLINVNKYKNMIQKEIKHLTKKDYFKLVRQGLELFEDFNRMAEDVARFNTYMTSRQEGRSIVEAINDAKEITVNFNKKGAGYKSINKLEPLYAFGNLAAYSAGIFKNLYLFFNAGIQSLFNFNSLYKKNWKKFGGLLGGFTAAGFLIPLVNSLFQSIGGDGDDEDYYANLSEWTRRNNLCLYIPGSKGHFITIPLPIELRAFYGLGDMAYQQTIGNGGKKGTEIAYDAVNQLTELLPLNPLGNNGDLGSTLMPDAAKPIWQVMKNEDFTGRPIYKKNSFNEDMPEWTKTYKGTSKWLTELSEWSNELGGGDKYKTAPDFLNWNPAVVEHVLQGYFGGMATTLNQLGKTMAAGVESAIDGEKSDDLTWRNTPVLSRFINDASDERSAFRGINEKYYQLYDVYKEVDKNLHGYSKEVSSGNLDYIEKLNSLYQSEEYKTYEIFKRSKNRIDRLNKLELELSDAMGDAKDKLQAEIKKLKKEIVEKVK